MPAQPLPFHPPFFYGWVIVAVAVTAAAVSSVASNVFTGSMVGVVIADMGWNRTEVTAAVTAATVLAAAVQPLLGRLADRHGPRLLIPFGAAVFTLGAFVLAGMGRLWQFYVGYVLMRAIGSSCMSGVVAQTAVVKWFVRMRGRTLGLTGMSLPVAQSVLVPIAQGVVATSGWRTVYAGVGVASVALAALPAALLMRRRPEDVGLEPDGGPGAAAAPRPGARAGRGREFSFYAGEAVRTRTFWLLILGQLGAIVASGAVSFHTTLFWTERGLPLPVAATALSMYALAGGLSSGVWGLLSERISERSLGIMVQSLAAVTLLLMLASDAPALAVFLTGLYGVASRGEGTIFNIMLANYYGRGHFGAIMGIFNPFSSVGLGIGPLVAAAGFDLSGGYLAVWLAFTVLHAISVLCLVFAAQPPLPPRAAAPPQGGPPC